MITDILKISGMILGLVSQSRDEDDKEQEWKVFMIQEWMLLVKKLMDIPMHNEVRASTLKNKLRSDFFQHYGEMPKDRWIDKLHSDLVIAVKGDLAVSG